MTHRTTLLSTTFLSAALSGALIACAPEAVAPLDTPAVEISTADLQRRIEKLASDEFEGRAPGTPGGIAASQYIADEMKAAGLIPMGENGTYFQNVELTESTVTPASNMTIMSGS
ncbi:hypothetical protein AB8615_06140 [Litorimonas sp. RW-G-Af-16]|uniref:hypothetical protein n=1 Tax=Litorimonas sp. RW-G-Af-16 TaxID=3241168 RepID=UPI003AB099A0